ncbi:MAG TPA: transcriptional regulator [Micromonosporaceae bacterium]|nr:transcriptional regulator [Micromonosporaceae bacterium]
MRASRLLSILLLLQVRGRMTAEALATELDVSLRTIYRDIEALHESGVALYGQAGRDGGFQLVDGYRTRLTGLTADEAAALSLAALPAAARDLGLSSAAAGAATKLSAALSDDLRRRADHIQRRLYFDPIAWYEEPDTTSLLSTVADAVWHDRRLRVTYRRWKAPDQVERTLEPFGLVLKSGRWYVVARGGARVDPNVGTYRVSQILAATPTGEHFVRPDDFDLAAHWRAYLADFAIRRHQEHATVRMSPLARQRMAHVMEPAIVNAVDASAGPADADGWVPARIPIESIRHAHDELLRLGAEVEVLAPAALRELLGRTAAALAARYDNPARDGTAPAQPVPVGS